jgi:hypothetical protein
MSFMRSSFFKKPTGRRHGKRRALVVTVPAPQVIEGYGENANIITLVRETCQIRFWLQNRNVQACVTSRIAGSCAANRPPSSFPATGEEAPIEAAAGQRMQAAVMSPLLLAQAPLKLLRQAAPSACRPVPDASGPEALPGHA